MSGSKTEGGTGVEGKRYQNFRKVSSLLWVEKLSELLGTVAGESYTSKHYHPHHIHRPSSNVLRTVCHQPSTSTNCSLHNHGNSCIGIVWTRKWPTPDVVSQEPPPTNNSEHIFVQTMAPLRVMIEQMRPLANQYDMNYTRPLISAICKHEN